MATRIYTKTGDRGDTGLFGGERVDKDHLRVEAYGTVDELNAVLGFARASQLPPPLDELAAELERLLFAFGAELATPARARQKPRAGVGEAEVRWLEEQIDSAERELPPLKHFILPAGTAASAALHVCRAVCRRAERRCVTLRRAEPDTDPLTIVFLNRLSDLLFVMARRANQLAGVEDAPWMATTR